MTQKAYEDFIGYCSDQELDENECTIIVRTKSGQTLVDTNLKGFNIHNADEVMEYVCVSQSRDDLTYISVGDIETLTIIKQ